MKAETKLYPFYMHSDITKSSLCENRNKTKSFLRENRDKIKSSLLENRNKTKSSVNEIRGKINSSLLIELEQIPKNETSYRLQTADKFQGIP